MFSFLPRLCNKFFPEAANAAARRREARYAEYAARRRQAQCVRPCLEVLEGRIVPNAYTWIPQAGSSDVQLDAGCSTMGLGAFIQTSSGQLNLQLASPYAYGSLNVTGNASLGGTLGVVYFGGYTPSTGDTFTALTAGSITHQFNVTPSDMTAAYGLGTVTLTEK